MILVRLLAALLALSFVGAGHAQTYRPGMGGFGPGGFGPGRGGFQFLSPASSQAGTGVPGLAAARTAANTSNPQTAGTTIADDTPTIAVTSAVPSGFTVQYPSTLSVANWQSSVLLEGGLPYIVGGKLYLRSLSTAGASSNWGTGASLTGVVSRITVQYSGTDLVLQTFDGGSGAPYFYRVLVNGVYTTRTGYSTGGSAFAAVYLQLTFPSAKARTITFELPAGTMPFTALFRRTTDPAFSKPADPGKPVILFVGDSISASAINDPTTGVTRANANTVSYAADMVARRAADRMGVSAMIDGVGGTGYYAGSSGNTRFNDRLFTGGDLAALTPSIGGIVFLGGINDAIAINGASITRATFQSTVNSIIAQVASTYPNIPVCVGGNYYNSSLVGAGTTPTGVNPQTEADIQAAVAAAKSSTPAARIGFFNVNNILNGSGSVAATAGNGNADQYLNSDRTHPNTAGEAYESPIVAQRAYDCLMAQ